jgi:hypothetical protein
MRAKPVLAWPEQPPDGEFYFPISHGGLLEFSPAAQVSYMKDQSEHRSNTEAGKDRIFNRDAADYFTSSSLFTEVHALYTAA